MQSTQLPAVDTPGPTDMPPFHSILFRSPVDHAASVEGSPAALADLHLDQVEQSLRRQFAQHDPGALFTTLLPDADAVEYRQEVFRDLAHEGVLVAIRSFSRAMDTRLEALVEAERSRHPLQKQSLSLEVVKAYCDATRELAESLTPLALTSRALQGLRRTLTALVDSESFTAAEATSSALLEESAAVRYAVRFRGSRVTVTRYDGQPDHGADVRAAFSRFQQDAPATSAGGESGTLQLSGVDSQILDGVAALHPELFAARAAFLACQGGHVDPAVERFHREVQFYLAWCELIRPLRDAGLPFCLPVVGKVAGAVAVEGGFDLALALSAVRDGRSVVGNDFELSGRERMLVVTGTNNGGKTTFARMVGQLFHLVALGVPVPARYAQLPLADRIFTHFEQEESSATQAGRFTEELRRVDAILQDATAASVVILNESFSSTNLSDALQVATRVVRTLLERGCIGVYVTFMDEIANLSDQTVSMVTQVLPEDPATRTFTLERAPADGRAHAWAIAEKYGLTRERLLARMRP